MSNTYTILERARDNGAHVLYLYQQHRMETHDLTSHISDTYYNGQLTDGTKGKKNSDETLFMRECIKEYFDVDGNFVFVKTIGSRSSREQAGHCMENKYHAEMMLQFNKFVLDKLQTTKYRIDKGKFTSLCVTVYKAQQVKLEDRFHSLDNNNFTAETYVVAQGMTKNMVQADRSNSQKFSDFAGDPCTVVVIITRHMNALVCWASKECLDPGSYPGGTLSTMLKDRAISSMFKLFAFAESQKAVVEKQVPVVDDCKKCGKYGHKIESCSSEVSVNQCTNCDLYGHSYQECPDEKLRAPPVSKKHPCKPCGGIVHENGICNGCHKCRTPSHKYVECPNRLFTKCASKEHGSRTTLSTFHVDFAVKSTPKRSANKSHHAHILLGALNLKITQIPRMLKWWATRLALALTLSKSPQIPISAFRQRMARPSILDESVKDTSTQTTLIAQSFCPSITRWKLLVLLQPQKNKNACRLSLP